MVEAGPSEEKGPPRESRRGEGGGGGSPPFFGCGPNVPPRRVIPLHATSRFRHKGAAIRGSAGISAATDPRARYRTATVSDRGPRAAGARRPLDGTPSATLARR